MNVHAYGSDVALDGTTLTLIATGKIGRGALGTDRRTVDVPTINALSLTPGNMLKNGRLEPVDGRGKSVVHFRRKTNGEMAALFAELVAIASAGADQIPTGDAPLFSEDAQASIAAMEAWMNQKIEARQNRK